MQRLVRRPQARRMIWSYSACESIQNQTGPSWPLTASARYACILLPPSARSSALPQRGTAFPLWETYDSLPNDRDHGVAVPDPSTSNRTQAAAPVHPVVIEHVRVSV
jgi:hypothetical protein